MSGVLLVTGGASGIGAAVARLAAERGFTLAINYRTKEQQARALVHELHAKGQAAAAFHADVSVPAQVEALYQRVQKDLGPLRAVVNSAGIATSEVRVADADAATLEQLLRTNVLGVMLSCREAARALSTKSGGTGGVIVNVSSMAATIGGRPGNSHYAASKAAVDSFSLGFAKEVAAEGIRVVSVRPGFTITDMTQARLDDARFRRVLNETIPLGRPARAEEIAAPIVWLLSSEASFITGTCLDISGGGFSIAGAPRQD
jgi:NAD(P)-dependent dehydrogenase (short-subunit alcohol dehydrogenase family)